MDGSYSSQYRVSAPDVFGQRPQPDYELVDAALRYALPSQRVHTSFGLIARNITGQNPMETLVGPLIDTSLRGRTIAMDVHVDY